VFVIVYTLPLVFNCPLAVGLEVLLRINELLRVPNRLSGKVANRFGEFPRPGFRIRRDVGGQSELDGVLRGNVLARKQVLASFGFADQPRE